MIVSYFAVRSTNNNYMIIIVMNITSLVVRMRGERGRGKGRNPPPFPAHVHEENTETSACACAGADPRKGVSAHPKCFS